MTLNRTIFVHGGHQVCGREGNFYSFYHFSYTGGEDVICTGCLSAINGELISINNDSGHYKATPAQILIVRSRRGNMPLRRAVCCSPRARSSPYYR